MIINGRAGRATQGASPKALGCLPECNTRRHRAQPSSWCTPGWRSGPRPPGCPGERTGHGAGSSGQEDLTLSRRRHRGAEGARASPALAPPGVARRKKSPSRDGTHAHPAQPWEGKPN
ncbi:hypothetical protein NDU88_004123 [Pleurodeles waltl]|uniref:Uncharacterized protein n=1 Tax=Pleurodeles waltl TaxID=8319 RepID=A0AAV7RKK6_PLEWA|nr:hypothetical protein NDU88_004123 [Pleurodeles waltl]